MGYDQPGVFFVVGGNDVPGRLAGARFAQAFRVGFGVGVPEFALLQIRVAEFPVLLAVVDTIEKALALLLLREVEKDFYDAGSIGVEVPFEVVDRTIAFAPGLLVVTRRVRNGLPVENFRVHANDQLRS